MGTQREAEEEFVWGRRSSTGEGKEAEIGGNMGGGSRQRQMDGVETGTGEREMTASDRPL